MTYSTVIGIDVSKKKLDLAILTTTGDAEHYLCENTITAITKALNSLLKNVEDSREVLLCAEHTSTYTYCLIQACKKLSLQLWLENPVEIKLSSGMQRGKNDKVDAYRIATYARRFTDKVRLYAYTDEKVDELRHLFREREKLVAVRSMEKTQLSDQKGYMDTKSYQRKAKRLKDHIKRLTVYIKEIEEEMSALIKSDAGLERKYDQIMSIDGIGPQTTLYVLVSTKGFTQFTTAKKFCCHAGVAPFAYSSGSSKKSRWHVSNRADKNLKRLLHMAAMSAINMDGEMKEYYERKVAEGKHAMSVLNAVRSKLIHRIFAVVKQDRKYEKNYIPCPV